MSQTDLNVANGSGAVVRADINAHLDALVSLSSGAAAPSPTFPNQWWMDTTNSILKQRDNANTAWISVASKVGSTWIPYRSGTLLGTAAIGTTGVSGHTIPFLDGTNTWANTQTYSGTVDAANYLKNGLAFSPPLRGYIDGLILSNNGAAPTTDVDIGAGVATDSTGAVSLTLASFTKRATTAWAVGTGNGGLFNVGYIGVAARYHVFLIEKDTDGSVDAGFDTNATATNRPAEYTRYRRIGSIQTDGSGNVIGFIQHGDMFLWTTVPALDINDAGLVATRTTYNLANVPSGIAVIALLNALTPARLVYISSPGVTDQAPSSTASPLFHVANVTGIAQAGLANFMVKTDTSARITARADAATATLMVSVIGWIDPRGRNG